jgi:5-carboxymethyl-2-hydroxymuconate isomerase
MAWREIPMQIPPFNRYIGSEVLFREKGEAEVVLTLKAHHLNRRGVAHGGVITSLLDSALGAAVISSVPEQWWVATTTLTTQFLEGVGAGKLIASGRVVRRGAQVAFATGEVRDEDGRLVATASGSWHLWNRRPGAGSRRVEGPWVAVEGGGTLRVGKILAVGRNYADHIVEMGAPRGAEPVLFFKPPTALAHDGDRLSPPADAGQVHHEVELVVAIGNPGRAIPEADALDHVLGFGVGLDLTLRDVQTKAKRDGEPWSVSKGFDGAAPVSQIVRRARVGDGSGLDIRLSVNGETRQQGNTSQMLHPVASLIALASRWVTLERGDLLFTGTPAGVGPVEAGDEVEATLERVGSLRVTIGGGEPRGE